MTRRQWFLAAALLGTACVPPTQLQQNRVIPTQQAAKKERPKVELVYLTPLPEALEVTRLVLESRGVPVGRRSETELITPKVADGEAGHRAYNRYYVQGVDLGQGRSIVRIFRTQQLDQAAGGMGRSDQKPQTTFAYRNALMRFAERAQMRNEAASAGVSADQSAQDIESGSGAMRALQAIEQQQLDQDASFDGMHNYEIEPFAFERGLRELNLEQEVTERLEATPSLELVGGQLPVPVKSLVVEDRLPVARPGAPRCTEDLPGGEALLEPGTTALVADPIGTREVPVALAQLACMATVKRVPFVIGLSVPSSEQPFIDAYLKSAGESADLVKLLTEGTFWRRSFQDGRSSQAVLGLVEHARALRAQGHDVDVLAFDAEELRGNPREVHMFERVKAVRTKRPDAAVVLAAGSVHVRNKKGAPWDPDFQPLGHRLTQAFPGERVLVLEEAFQRGPQYACRFNSAGRVECRVYARSPTYASLHPFELPRGLELYAQPGRDGAHGRLRLGALSASLPALRLEGGAQRPPATVNDAVR